MRKIAGIIFVIIGIVLMVVGIALPKNNNVPSKNNKEEKEETTKKEEKKEEKNKEEPVVQTKEEYKDQEIYNIYDRYHGSRKLNSTDLYKERFETYLYEKDTFNISELKGITYTLGHTIYIMAEDELKPFIKTASSEDDVCINGYGCASFKYVDKIDAQPIIEKYMKVLFGDELKYDDSLFKGCHPLALNVDDKYAIEPACGGMVSQRAEFNLVSHEKDEDHLYLTEKVILYKDDKDPEECYYKWTFNKDSNNNYYFVKAEKQV